MAVIASLNVLLKADAAQFYATMDKGQKALASFSAEITQSSRNVFAWAAGIGTAMAGGGIVALVKHSFEAMDATGKLAERLSVSTEELTRLQYAAKLTNTETETLHANLAKMTRLLGEAAGTEGMMSAEAMRAGEGVKTLGLDLDMLLRKSPAEAFTDIVDRISKITNAFERSAMAKSLFGKAGQEMLNVLMLGRSGLKAFGEESDRLRTTLTSLESAQIEEADQAFKRMQQTIDGVVKTFTIKLVPILEEAAKRFTSWAVDGVNAAGQVERSFTSLEYVIARIMDTLTFDFPTVFNRLQQGALIWMRDLPKIAADMGYQLWHGMGRIAPLGTEYMQVPDPENPNAPIIPFTESEKAAMAAKGWKEVTPDYYADSAFDEAIAKIDKKIEERGKKTLFVDALANYDMAQKREALAKARELEAAGKGGAYDMSQVYADKDAKEREAIRKQVDAMLKSSESPMQKYESIISNLNVWLASGNVSWDEYAQGVRHAREELEKASRVSGLDKLAPALSMSYSSFGKMTQQGPVSSGSALDNIKTNTADTARNTGDQKQLLREINEHISALRLEVVSV